MFELLGWDYQRQVFFQFKLPLNGKPPWAISHYAFLGFSLVSLLGLNDELSNGLLHSRASLGLF